MGTTITPVATWQATVTGPADGEARTATSVNTGLQGEANRSQYLYETCLGATAGQGITRIRAVDDYVALQALTGMEEDDLCLVRQPKRIYVFQTSDPGVQEPFQYDADDASGVWLWAGQFGLDDQLGTCLVVTDDATEQLLRPDVVPNRIVKEQVATNTGTGTITNVNSAGGFSSYADTGVTITVTGLLAGDVVHFDCTFLVEQNSVTGGKYRMISQEDAGTKTLVDGTEHTVNGSARTPAALTGRYVMSADADLTLTLQGMATGGDYSILASSTLRATVIRP